MAYIYFQEGRWDKAIEEYKKLIALDPEDINTHNMLGDVYVKKGASREAFEEYIKVSTDFSSRGQSDKAIIVNKKIAALDTGLLPPEAQKKQNLIKQTLKAETAMEQGDVDSAIDALTEVLKLDGENLAAFYKLGELFEKKGQVAEAVKQYQMLGAAFLKNRLYKKSQEMYQKVALLDPSNTDAHVNLAQIFVKQGSESDAKKEYLTAAEQALNAGDLEGANAHAAKAVELKSIEAHYVQGVVFFKRQKLSEAKAEFESLLRFKVNHVGALTHLGRVLLELNQPDKAAENIQKALKLEKDNLAALEAWVEVSLKKGSKAEAVTTLGTLIDRYAAKGDHAKAAEFARALHSLDENSAAAHTKLAEALLKSGDRNAAADTHFKLALLYEKQDKKDASMESTRKALELNPNHVEAQSRILGGQAAAATPAVKPPAGAPAAAAPATPEAPPPAKAPAAGVLDLEQEIAKPFSGPPKTPAAPPPQAPAPEKIAPPAPAADPEEDLRAQLSIADNYLKQGMVEEAIEIYQQLSEAYPENAQVKQKLSQAYTAYVKTGEDVIGALEAEKKAKEEEERNLRAEMEKKAQEEARRLREELEQKARQEAEKTARAELEKRAREEAEQKAREEMERLARAEAERKQKEEMERKARDESLRKAQEEAQRRAREEAERKVREEKAAAAPATSRTPPPSKGDSLEEGRDEFMTIAVAEIYERQGLLEDAAKIYRHITRAEPDNLEARKKLGDVEAKIKSKGGSPAPASGPAKPFEPPAGAAPSPGPPPSRPPDPEKDSGGKKKSNRVGYV